MPTMAMSTPITTGQTLPPVLALIVVLPHELRVPVVRLINQIEQIAENRDGTDGGIVASRYVDEHLSH